MAKKKKPAGNPARGFATTSVASKPKVEKVVVSTTLVEDKDVATKDIQVTPLPVAQDPAHSQSTKETVVQTPEELEAQLERDELQLLVDKHASKVRRDSHRNVTKFHTDRRVLRGQSHTMTVHDWLPNDILDGVVALAQAESNDSNRRQVPQTLLKTLSEEDATARLWTLDLTLRELGFADEHTRPVLTWLCANAASVDATGTVWGLQEALEWLALDQAQGHDFTYQEQTTRRVTHVTPVVSRPGKQFHMFPNKLNLTRSVTPSQDSPDGDNSNMPDNTSKSTGTETPATSLGTPEAEHYDVHVSDLDSDLELDDLVPMYLKIKSKLYEMDPELVEPSARKQGKGKNLSKTTATASRQSPAVKKLVSQLTALKSDALFDEHEADALWPARRNEVAKKRAAKREQAASASTEEEASSSVVLDGVGEHEAGANELEITGSEDEADLLGDMFSAIPEQNNTDQTNLPDSDSSHVTLKDFGKSTGLTPRRLLEEAIRSR